MEIKISAKYRKFLIIGFLIFVPLALTYYFPTDGLPQTDGSVHYFNLWFMKANLESTGQIPNWNLFWYNGSPIYRFYPPLFYWFALLVSYLPLELHQTFNLTIALSFVILSFSTYFLAKALKFSTLTSLLVAFLVVISPRLMINTTFSGTVANTLAISIFPFALGFLIKTIQENKNSYKILAGIFSALVMLSHHQTGYYLLYIFGAIFLYYLFLGKLENWKSLLSIFAIVSLVFVGITSFWIFPAIMEFNQLNLLFVATPLDPIKVIFEPINENCSPVGNYWCIKSLGTEFSILGIIGLILGLVGFSKLNGKINLRFDKKYLLIVIWFFVSLLLFLSNILGFDKFLPFGNSLDYDRMALNLILPLSLSIGVILERTEKHRLILFIVLLIIFSRFFFVSYIDGGNYLFEGTPVPDKTEFSYAYEFMKTQEIGRVAIFGFYPIGPLAGIPIATGLPMVAGSYVQSSKSFDKLGGKIDPTWNANLFSEVDKNKFYKIMNDTYTKYVFVDVCDDIGKKGKEIFMDNFIEIFSYNSTKFCLEILKNDMTVYYTDPPVSIGRSSSEEIQFYNVKEESLLVKESYYPHWHAYCNNQQLKVDETDNNMMLIHTTDCNKLELRFEVPLIYQIFNIISIVTFIMSLFFILLPFRKSIFHLHKSENSIKVILS